jgi:3-methylfumaryl-CoA hydratase
MSADLISNVKPDYLQVIGRREQTSEFIDLDRVMALANTLGVEPKLSDGDALPSAWHWIFFNSFVPRAAVGTDGHPKTGGFLPDVGLPRRMWAGGRVLYHAPLPIGSRAEKMSEILSVTEKSGKAGRLVFVTVKHAISHDGIICIEEEQDLVYREPPQEGAAPPPPQAAPTSAEWSHDVTPDPVLLFRYSALTLNGHRIHYDRPYAREEEDYPDLVVHGPLISTILHGLAQQAYPQKRLSAFEFRAVAPLFVSDRFSAEAAKADDGQGLSLWARSADGHLAMRASASFSD